MRGDTTERTLGDFASRTAFERNLLPGFAEWALEQIERWEPDYLVPAETKGARILDAVLSFGRDHLGARVTAPVVYAGALSYLPAQELRTARMMIVEDAVRTGSNLGRHRELIAGHEVEEIEAIACIGCGADSGRRTEVACFLQVDAELYQRYVWQLAELVVGRGLPPEVDHFLFELQLPGRLAVSYPQLAEALAEYGVLTVDGPKTRSESIQPMTLHFPRLPDARALPPETGDGAFKLRFFPDLDGDRVFVVPISLPTLRLPAGAPGAPMPTTLAMETVESELGHVPPVAELLVERAYRLDPKTLFRAVSAGREVELMRGLAHVLREQLPGSALRAQTEVFDRLFGPVGPSVSELVAEKLKETLYAEEQQTEVARFHDQGCEPHLFLDGEVEFATEGIARELKRLYDKASEDPEHDPAARIGGAMSQLAGLLSDNSHSDNSLLASRCVDFGLALTTLVPYIDEIPGPNGTLRVQRCYRVSENNRGKDRSYLSLDSIRREKSEEAMALICMRLRGALDGFEDRSIPSSLLGPVVAIMRSLVLEERSISLKALPSPYDELDLVLLDTVAPVPIDAEVSGHFKIGDSGDITPTEGFERLYEEGGLTLDLDESTERIEENLDKVIAMLEGLGENERQTLLEGWSMSIDRRLGLSHVRCSLQEALRVLRQPLNLIRTGETHERSEGIKDRVASALEAAQRKLALLQSDWSEPTRKPKPSISGRAKKRILGSLGAAKEAAELLDFASALCDLVGALAEVVERLDAVSAEGWREDRDQERLEVVRLSLRHCASAGQALRSFEAQEPTALQPEGEIKEQIAVAAGEVLDLVELADGFAAAIAGAYCGPKRRVPPPNAEEARHAAILSLDLDGSTARAEAVKPSRNKRWIGEGLGMAAQWTRVFGGYEFSDRKGDELTVEFGAGDRAALAAAAVLCHSAALRSTGVEDVSWTFHAGIDCGEIDDGDGGNVIGSCVNRAAKLAKALEGEDRLRRVPIGEEATRFCSSALRSEPLSGLGEEVLIGERQVHPRLLDASIAIKQLSAQVQAAAAEIAAELPAMTAIDPVLEGTAGDEVLEQDATQSAG